LVSVFRYEEGFAGGCIVEAGDMKEAISAAWMLGINPGGEVMGKPVEKGQEDMLPRNRLLSKAEMMKFGPIYRYGDTPQNIGNN
jgi:hypothetical protein